MQDYKKRNRLIAVACAAVALVCLFASEGVLRGAALLSAGIGMPQGAASLFAPPPPRPAPRETVADALIPTAAAKTAAGSANPQSRDFDITATPADILLLMEEAQEEYTAQTRDGDIVAKTYTNKDATHSWKKYSLNARNTTKTQSNRDLSKDLAAPLDLQIDKSKPAVLIFHTHTTEGFEILERPWYAAEWTSRTENGAKSVVRVGEAIAQMLERAGFQVIHDSTIYDRQYTGAYDKSRAAVKRYLEEYPSIQVTLDIHRDAIHNNRGERIKPVADILGKQAAQVMIITGVEEGTVKGYPNWEQNLRFAAKLHAAAQTRCPGLMKPMFFCARRYNMDLTPFSLLLEMGADANTLEEAVYSGRLIGETLGIMLNEYVM